MIHGKYLGQGEDLTAVKKIRNEVFSGTGYNLREELDSLALNVIVDTDEYSAVSCGKEENCAKDETAKKSAETVFAATGRLLLDIENDRFYADNICVLKEYRRRHYGEFVLRMLADKACECMAEFLWAEVSVNTAKPFFKKMFFEEYEGNLMRARLEDFKVCCHNKDN